MLSGNRNFPGRVHPQLEAGFLASPPLVVAFALAGDVNRDILADPIGRSASGAEIRLADLWPTGAEIDTTLAAAVDPADYAAAYDRAEASEDWARLDAPESPLFPWDEASTYIRRPPFAGFGASTRLGVYRAHPLIVLGDDITTDHISPAGQIPTDSEAAEHLAACGEDRRDLNVFAARRGNWQVMLRGLFTNRSVRNLLAPGIDPGSTIHAGSGEALPLWRAAERYEADGEAVVIVAGERYGMGVVAGLGGQGRGAARRPRGAGARLRADPPLNLIGMGVLPLRLARHPAELGLAPGDRLAIEADPDRLAPRAAVPVTLHRATGGTEALQATAAVETTLEIEILRAGGIIPLILRRAIGTG